MCSLTIECVLLLYRMCSLTIECVLLLTLEALAEDEDVGLHFVLASGGMRTLIGLFGHIHGSL